MAPKPATNGLAAPTFSVAGGIFGSNVTLSLSATQGLTRYTLDGNEPTAHSPAFTAPLLITNCLTVRARAFADGEYPSPAASASFVILDPDIAEFSSELPIVVLSTGGDEFTTDNKLAVGLHCQRTGQGTRATLTGLSDYAGRAVAGFRGRSSRKLPKHSFNIRLVENGNDDKRKAEIFGLPRDSDWVLYAPYSDKTLIRDVLGYELSNALGRYAPRTRLVEVFLNTGGTRLQRGDYAGVYVFEERITRAKDRLNLEALQPEDIAEPDVTGGYIFKKDHLGFDREDRLRAHQLDDDDDLPAPYAWHGLMEPGGFPADPQGIVPPKTTTKSVSKPVAVPSVAEAPPKRVGDLWPNGHQHLAGRNLADGSVVPEAGELVTRLAGAQLFFVYPDPEDVTGRQRAWLKEHLENFEAALHGPDFRDPIRGYAAYLDPGSFIDHHLLTEAMKNVDGFRFSTFFHKDRGGKIQMGPLWDLNLSFGNASGKEGYLPERWLWPQLNNHEYSWFRRLFEDPDFGQRYVDRYAELRTNVLATARVLGRVDDYAALLSEAQQRNFARWPLLGVRVPPNYFVGTNYAHEISWMKGWIARRLEWMDAQFLAAPMTSIPGGGALTVEFTNSTPGEILCTVQGPDPRASGGSVAPAAKIYEAPIPLKAGDRLCARRHLGNRWSAPCVVIGR